GAGGGADQGLDGASLGDAVLGGDHAYGLECEGAFSHVESGFVSLVRPRPGADESDDAEDAAGRDRDLDGEVGDVDHTAGGDGEGRRSKGVAEDASGDRPV